MRTGKRFDGGRVYPPRMDSKGEPRRGAQTSLYAASSRDAGRCGCRSRFRGPSLGPGATSAPGCAAECAAVDGDHVSTDQQRHSRRQQPGLASGLERKSGISRRSRPKPGRQSTVLRIAAEQRQQSAVLGESIGHRQFDSEISVHAAGTTAFWDALAKTFRRFARANFSDNDTDTSFPTAFYCHDAVWQHDRANRVVQ